MQQRSDASTGGKRNSKADGKGNVVVSVRVRPDAAGNENKADGEWMVDGRKSLISYRGKEGGDYFYGKTGVQNVPCATQLTVILQIMFSRRMTTTPKSTTISLSG
jgi:hypothetical protein